MPNTKPLYPTEALEKINIEYFLTLGDSLSDRGTLDKRKLFGIIPMDFLAGLSGRSPKGRFTNGFTWDDHLAAMIASELDRVAVERQQQPQERLEPQDEQAADDGDAILTHQARVEKTLRKHAYALDDDLHVHYHGENLLDSYNEGGLTAHPYRNSSEGTMGWSLSRYFSRKILSSLPEKRRKALAYADRHHLTDTHRKKTLVMEWSGANDLITVNAFPTPDEVKKAVQARIDNVVAMAEAGYRRFMLMDMPDLSKTPRYQTQLPEAFRGLNIDFYTSLDEADLEGSQEEAIDGITFTKLTDGRYLLSKVQLEAFYKQVKGGLNVANAQLASKEFNRQLHLELHKKQDLINSACKGAAHSVEVFPVSDLFDEVFHSPQAFHFDPKKIHEPYTKSADYREKGSHHISDAHGHMFWDDIHPSAHMHKLLAERVYEHIEKKYHFIEPISQKKETHQDRLNQLVNDFYVEYKRKLAQDKKGTFGGWRKGKLPQRTQDATQDLKTILRHALFEGGDRTFELTKALQWFGSKGLSFDRSDIKCGLVEPNGLIIEKALHDVINERHAPLALQNVSVTAPRLK